MPYVYGVLIRVYRNVVKSVYTHVERGKKKSILTYCTVLTKSITYICCTQMHIITPLWLVLNLF